MTDADEADGTSAQSSLDDSPVPSDELTPEDHSALRWAVSVNHEVGAWAVRRARLGGESATTRELRAVRNDWETAGCPAPDGPHRHRTNVVFDEGTTAMGVTFVDDDPYTRDQAPAFGLYLDERWSPPWPHEHVAWPDFGVPADGVELRAGLVDLLERARRGEKVEVGCWGGHGRTGTALACLAVLAGTPASEAVRWVRHAYCRGAVETPDQERFIAEFA